jgi:hypothetical protein
MGAVSLMLAAVMFLISGCAGKQIRLERTDEVKKTFQEVDIDPKEYAFFTAGPQSTPEAILLIKNAYLGDFDSSGWKLRDKETIMDLLKRISEATRPGKQYGFPVVTEEGGPVKGMMFTAFPHARAFVDKEEGVFRVATPAMLDTGQGTLSRTSCSISVCQ